MQEQASTGLIQMPVSPPLASPLSSPSNPQAPFAPLYEIKSPADVQREQAQRESLERQAIAPKVLPGLLTHVQDAYYTARRARENSFVDTRLLNSQERRACKYSQSALAAIRQSNMPDKYVPATAQKCQDAEAWWNDIESSVGDRSVDLKPSPVQNLDEEAKTRTIERFADQFQIVSASMVQAGQQMDREATAELFESLQAEQRDAIQEEAAARAKRMLTLIRDQLKDAGYGCVKQAFKTNIITFGTGILKAPVVKFKKMGKWNGTQYVVTDTPIMTVEAPSPDNIFPSPENDEIDDLAYICERTSIPRHELSKCAKSEGKYWRKDEINTLLSESAISGTMPTVENNDPQRRELANKPSMPETKAGPVECIEFWGNIEGSLLKSFGFTSLTDTDFYPFQVIYSGSHVLKVMPNPDPMGRLPYYKSVFKRIPGSFWGQSLPETMEVDQDGVNGCYRAMVKNFAFASGPIIAQDITRLPANQNVAELAPWSIRWFTSRPGDTSKAMEFWQADDRSRTLMVAIDKMLEWADKHTGVPPFVPSAEAMSAWGRTARGASMLLSAAGRGMKDMIGDADRAQAALLERWYVWNMIHHNDPSVKGDAQIVVHGTLGVLIAEMQEQRVEQLITLLSQPNVQEIIGPEPVAEAMREFATIMRLDGIAQVIPNAKQIAERIEKQQAAAAQAEQAPPPTETEADRALKLANADKAIAKAEETRANAPIKGQKLLIDKAKAVKELAQPQA